MTKRKVLVAGATGNQGGAVVNALLNSGHEVIGISRNTKSKKAEQLSARGVRMISVEFTNKTSMISAMREVDTVFSVTTPFEGGIEGEIEQGITMADAAEDAGVGHFIFNSVGDANKETGIPHFDSKYEVEKHLEKLQLPYTIIGPSYFMDNLFFPFMLDSLIEGVLKMAMPGDIKLQQIAAEDIGKFVGMVVSERESFFRKRIDISGDELTGYEAAAILTKVLGKEIKYEGYNPDFMRGQSEDMALMYEWFVAAGYSCNLNDLKKYNFMSFEEWANKQDWNSVL